MSEKVKKCPNCEHVNNEFAFICPECRYSLMHVEAEDSSSVSGEKNSAAPVKEQPDQKKEEKKSESQKPRSPLTDVLNQSEAFLEYPGPPAISFRVNPGDIAGRDGTIDLSQLENSNFISREHARIIFKEGSWHIENLAQTNKTFVNHVQVQPGEEHILSDGDQLILANVRLIFQISR